jgi:adenylate cyclase
VKHNPLKLVPTLIAVGVVAIVCVLHILPLIYPNFSLLQKFEWRTYDWRVQITMKTNSIVPPVLGAVFIDDDTIKIINEQLHFSYPWPRYLYGLVIQELKAQGAKAVGFDILFAELQPPSTNTDVQLASGPMHSDEYFAAQLKRTRNVILAVMDGEATTNNQWQGLPPHPLFRTNTLGIAHIVTDTDADGVLRRALAYRDDPNLGRIWNMGIVLASLELDLDLKNPTFQPGKIILRSHDGKVERTIPVEEDGSFYINWTLTWNDRRIQRDAVINLLKDEDNRRAGEKVEAKWNDRIVVLGSIGQGNNITDMGTTPVDKKTYLVSKHWNVAYSVITGDFIRKSPIVFDLLCIWFLGCVSAFLTWELRIVKAGFWVVLLAFAYALLSVFLFNQYRIWIPIVLPVVGSLFMTHLCMITYRVIFEQNERRRVKAVFSKLVSPDVVNEVLNSETLSLGGARRMITVFFADVRGFTEFTDTTQAKAEKYVLDHKLTGAAAEKHFDDVARESLSTVNLYLTAISDTIKLHKGTLDKYIGDCVMAFWGAPVANEKHACCCVKSAIDAQRAMYRLNQERAAENQRREEENKKRVAAGQPPLEMQPLLSLGSGINTGVSIVGLMGSEANILNYTVFGREVNVASRLEGVSGRGRIIIAESTYLDIKRDDPELAATCVELPPVTVKGIKQAVKIYEVPWKQGLPELPAPAPAAVSKPSTTDATQFVPKAPGPEAVKT